MKTTKSPNYSVSTKLLHMLLAVLAVLCASSASAQNLNHAGYKRPLNPFDQWASTHYECTRYAWGRAHETTGVSMTFTADAGRHGGKWPELITSNFQMGDTPARNSVISWTEGTYGHVAFVEDVVGDSIVITEANFSVYGQVNTTRQTLSRATWLRRGNYRFYKFIYLNPAAPSSLSEPFVQATRVGMDWASVANANAYRIQVALSGASWTRENGFSTSSSASSSVPVNAGISSDPSSYVWEAGSAGIWSTPVQGQTYQWTVRVNVPGSGSSFYTSPRSFTIPRATTTPVMTLSTTNTGPLSVTQYGTLPAWPFTIRNSGTGTLSYTATDDSPWMSVSPSSGTSVGGAAANTVYINFNTSGYSAQTLNGTITVSAPGVAAQTISVRVTITAPPTIDDHGSTFSSATTLNRNSYRAGNLEKGGDVDMFKITVSGTTRLTLYSTGSSSVDTKAVLYDSSGSQKAEGDNENGNNQFSITRTLTTGTYYLKVTGRYSSTTGAYRVYVN